MLPRTVLVALAAIAFGAALFATPACGTDPVGVDACRKIERVRCESAPACGISLKRPVHHGDSPKEDVAACIRFYDDQCLHGVALPNDPEPQAVDACVSAIINGDCAIVQEPHKNAACAFLKPGVEDAGADADDATAE